MLQKFVLRITIYLRLKLNSESKVVLFYGSNLTGTLPWSQFSCFFSILKIVNGELIILLLQYKYSIVSFSLDHDYFREVFFYNLHKPGVSVAAILSK